MRDLTTGMDKVIQEAQAEGKFDDLEGKGKPLVLDPSPDAIIRNLLKEANVKPAWIELESQLDRALSDADDLLERFAADVEAVRERLQASLAVRPAPADAPRDRWLARVLARLSPGPSPTPMPAGDLLEQYHRRWDTRLARYAGLLHQANGLLRRFNLVVPMTQRQRRPIGVAERLEAFAERFPCFERGPDGAPREVRGVVPESLLSPPREEGADPQGKRDLQRAAALDQVRRFGRRPPPIG
jgi:hypothetical protein